MTAVRHRGHLGVAALGDGAEPDALLAEARMAEGERWDDRVEELAPPAPRLKRYHNE